jgi:hypothetical protein
MAGVLEKRRELLGFMRDFTLEKGFFTVNDIAGTSGIPRSTVQDWINRLAGEKCIILKEEKRGRVPARYVTTGTMLQSACKSIFTTVDGNNVLIFHECRSGGCAAFCRHHHSLAGGGISRATREGTLLVEYASVAGHKGDMERIGLFPDPAVGIADVRRTGTCGEFIVQTIRCIGGPAYSLTDMMSLAEGVVDVKTRKIESSSIVEGEVTTKALSHLIIGIDDTDSKDGGATFALALGLLQYLRKVKGVIPIVHRVVMLKPDPSICTTGNSCSYIELAVDPVVFSHVRELALRFVEEESLSEDWGIAFKCGFEISDELRDFGRLSRRGILDEVYARNVAKDNSISLYGGRGIIGARAAISFRGLSNDIQLNPYAGFDA